MTTISNVHYFIMTYDQLLEFVQEYMPKRMQHIYLPLLVGEIVDSDGSATIRQLAEAVLAKDESPKGHVL